jgi:putative tryptophan/tyrosine transport system substrate-binding protein
VSSFDLAQDKLRRKARVENRKKSMAGKVFVWLLATFVLTTCSSAEAQQPKKIPRIGYLGLSESPSLDGGFRKGLRELGYVEGHNINVEYRFAEGKVDRLADLANELVSLKVNVVVASSTQSIEAAKQATKAIPIVFPITPDPIKSGFVASFARPGGNITGLSTFNPELGDKRLELLKEVIPGISRVAVLWNPTNPGHKISLEEAQIAAKALGLQLQSLEVRGPEDFEGAFRAATKQHAGALNVLADLMLASRQKRIHELAIKSRMPTVFNGAVWVTEGSLMSYGPSNSDLYRRAATYVDKILKGAKPADLPVERPTKFELVINLKTAKQIGLTIPPNVLARADKVIR